MRLIYSLILIFLIIIILGYKKYIDYENYKNEPYITVVARGGLNNKIRVMLSYLYRANKENKKLIVIWIKDTECPDDYNTLFYPIKNMDVISYNNNMSDFETWEIDNEEYVQEKYHKLLKPLPNIQKNIQLFQDLLGSQYIACHIRRTDIVIHKGQPWYKPKTDKEYMDFIDQYDSNLNIYIATDNKDTQDVFINKYKNRVIIKPIIPSAELRQTSLQDALVDMYVCIGSTYFLGSKGSSFTDTITYMRK